MPTRALLEAGSRARSAEGSMLAVVLAADANGLGAVRNLAAARIPTVAVVLSATQLARFSRFARKCVVPGNGDQETSLLLALEGLPEPAVLLPTSDCFVRFLLKHHDLLARRFAMAMPPRELTRELLDKARQAQLASAIGVPLPATVHDLPAKAGELGRMLPFPMILKPRSAEQERRFGHKNIVVGCLEDLEAVFQAHSQMLDGLIAQECIPGDDGALWVCDCVFGRNSELVSAFTFRKLRTSPAHFGVSSLAVSERNERLVDLAQRLGKKLGYVGPADFDFKYDARDGQYKYLEVNPRLGMCNMFAARCGINSVVDAYRVAAGYPVSPLPQQTQGAVYLNLYDDLRCRLKDGERPTAILRSYLELAGRRWVGPMFSWSDPLPGIYGAWRNLLGAASGLRRRWRPIRKGPGGAFRAGPRQQELSR